VDFNELVGRDIWREKSLSKRFSTVAIVVVSDSVISARFVWFKSVLVKFFFFFLLCLVLNHNFNSDWVFLLLLLLGFTTK